MDALKVREILDSVREDHDLVSEQLHILEELERTVIGPESRHLDRALDLLRGASQFFQTRLLPHLDEEERGMFLLFRERLPPGSTLIYELESEHEQMREFCERLREELSLIRHKKHRKPAVVAHLQELCVRITALLSQHARQEEILLERYRQCECREGVGRETVETDYEATEAADEGAEILMAQKQEVNFDPK